MSRGAGGVTWGPVLEDAPHPTYLAARARYADLLATPMSITERAAVEALVEYGSQNRAAEALGWKRTKLQSRLRAVQRRARAADAAPDSEPTPVVRGRRGVLPNNVPHDPATAPAVSRYILTAAQNNTYVHEAFLANLEAYAKATGARIMVARFTYDKASHKSPRAVKPGCRPTHDDHNGLWYDPAILPYVCDDPKVHGSCRWQLAPDLLWCAEMNVLPTAERPLSGLESYAGAASGIFPHAKIALESIPVIGKDTPPKFNYATGAVTQRNYIAKKAGLKGEFHHAYGALMVEVDNVTGDWWARQLNATEDGAFFDKTHRVADGRVSSGHALLAMQWGDVHASEIDADVLAVNWGRTDGTPGALDILQPRFQFWHDSDSFRNRSHHEEKSFEKRFRKWAAGPRHDEVEIEITILAELLHFAARPWCQTIVVSSNHDRHGDRWLDECDPKKDLPNARYFHEASAARARALADDPLGSEWTFLEWALEREFAKHGATVPARLLRRDESFVIGPPGHEVECGGHGDEGANGARGSAVGLSKIGTRMNVGHSHSACLLKGLAQAGVCARRLAYAHGASSWSISHIGTYDNGKRAIYTQRGGKLWL